MQKRKYLYNDVIGLPSGEVLTLPFNIVSKLIKVHLIYNEFIFDGTENRLRYAYDDEDYDEIIDYLGSMDDNEW